MPPVIVWAAGTLGALVLARIVALAARKVNADLEAIRREQAPERPVVRLERDPRSGAYRPRGH